MYLLTSCGVIEDSGKIINPNEIDFEEYVEFDTGYNVRSFFKLLLLYPLLKSLNKFTEDYIDEFQSVRGSIENPTGVIIIEKIFNIESHKITSKYDIYIEEKDGRRQDCDLTPMKEILHYPIKFRGCKNIFEETKNFPERFDYDFTLYEFVSSLMGEISYWGNPKDKKKIKKEE